MTISHPGTLYLKELENMLRQTMPDSMRLALLLEKVELLENMGELDTAIAVLKGEALTNARNIGSDRDIAIVRGKIAHILQAQEALSLDEERLPRELENVNIPHIVELPCIVGRVSYPTFQRRDMNPDLLCETTNGILAIAVSPIAKRLGDIESIAQIKYSIASLRLQRGDYKSDGFQQIREDLSEAFAISLKLGRPDFIGEIGKILGVVLKMDSRNKEALAVLQHAEKAFKKLGDTNGLRQVKQIRAMIHSTPNPTD